MVSLPETACLLPGALEQEPFEETETYLCLPGRIQHRFFRATCPLPARTRDQPIHQTSEMQIMSRILNRTRNTSMASTRSAFCSASDLINSAEDFLLISQFSDSLPPSARTRLFRLTKSSPAVTLGPVAKLSESAFDVPKRGALLLLRYVVPILVHSPRNDF